MQSQTENIITEKFVRERGMKRDLVSYRPVRPSDINTTLTAANRDYWYNLYLVTNTLLYGAAGEMEILPDQYLICFGLLVQEVTPDPRSVFQMTVNGVLRMELAPNIISQFDNMSYVSIDQVTLAGPGSRVGFYIRMPSLAGNGIAVVQPLAYLIGRKDLLGVT